MNNKHTVRTFVADLFNTEQTITNTCCSDVVLHWRSEPLINGLDEFITFSQAQRQCFPDIAFELLDMIEEGDRIAVRLQQTGTLQTQWQGIDRPGAQYSIEEMMFFRLKNGKIQEIWPIPDMESKKNQILASK